MDIAIYDLDKTITRRPTFTHFLLFFARFEKPLRLFALPLWVIALVGYRLGLYGRKPLKQFGVALFIGTNIDRDLLQRLAVKFTVKIIPHDVQRGALQSIENDRQSGRRLILATAAPQFYAECIAQQLGFDAVVATLHFINTDGSISNRIDGENCYGNEKLTRVQAWLDTEKISRNDVNLCFYSDHPSDAPMFDWVDEAILVAANPGTRLRTLAKAKHWQIVDFS